MITLYSIKNEQEWEADLYQKLLSKLPEWDQKKYTSILRWQDRQSGILGKFLLKKGIKEMGADVLLEDLRLGVFQKPYFEKGPNFNISHSGHYVVCAISTAEDIGIDIEERLPDICLSDFECYLSPDEWTQLTQSPDRILWFYDYWTQKEAVLKGNGEGLEIPLNEILLLGDRALIKGTNWYLYTIAIDNFYSCHIASLQPADISHKILTLSDLTGILYSD